MRAWLALARHGGRWTLGTPGQAEPVHLADHRVTGNATEFRRNLTRRQSVAPEFLQEFHSIVRPIHGSPSLVPGPACPTESRPLRRPAQMPSVTRYSEERRKTAELHEISYQRAMRLLY